MDIQVNAQAWCAICDTNPMYGPMRLNYPVHGRVRLGTLSGAPVYSSDELCEASQYACQTDAMEPVQPAWRVVMRRRDAGSLSPQ